MITAVFMLSNSPTPLYVHWQEQMGFSSGMLTVIFALYIAGLLGTLLVAGQLSDHYGRKPVLLPGLLAALWPAGCSPQLRRLVCLPWAVCCAVSPWV